MAMKKFLSKSLRLLANSLEKKDSYSSTSYQSIVTGIYGLGYQKGIGWLSALGAINYYNQVSPIANAVDLIAQKGAEIYIAVWDKIENKYIKEAETGTPYKIFELLKRLDFTKTYSEFTIYELSYYLITGNMFIISQYMDGGEPTNIILAKPQDITIVGRGTSLAQKYYWTDGSRSLIFELDEIQMRYFATDKAGIKYELKHVRAFNPRENDGNLWGQSKLTQIYLEMEQYIAGAIHNKNLLANGARPSGVLTLDEEMSNDAYEKARAEVKNFYSGSKNAGNILIFEGEGAKFEGFSISPRDMDFANLSEKNTTAIYNRLNIPLPFVSTQTMTYDNLKEALYQLYILAVIPLIEIYYEALTDLLLWHYKDGERYEIHYDEMDIDVLADHKKDDYAKTIQLGITTYNEARGMYSLDAINEGGDDVFVSPALVPLGQPVDENTTKTVPKKQERNRDVETDNGEEEKGLVSKDKFTEILKKQNYSDAQISEAIKRVYGN